MIDTHDVIAIEDIICNATRDLHLKSALALAGHKQHICACSSHGSHSNCVGTLKVNITVLKAVLKRIEEEL